MTATIRPARETQQAPGHIDAPNCGRVECTLELDDLQLLTAQVGHPQQSARLTAGRQHDVRRARSTRRRLRDDGIRDRAVPRRIRPSRRDVAADDVIERARVDAGVSLRPEHERDRDFLVDLERVDPAGIEQRDAGLDRIVVVQGGGERATRDRRSGRRRSRHTPQAEQLIGDDVPLDLTRAAIDRRRARVHVVGAPAVGIVVVGELEHAPETIARTRSNSSCSAPAIRILSIDVSGDAIVPAATRCCVIQVRARTPAIDRNTRPTASSSAASRSASRRRWWSCSSSCIENIQKMPPRSERSMSIATVQPPFDLADEPRPSAPARLRRRCARTPPCR